MDVVEAARRYIGTPWLHCCSSPAGMDCAGLLLAVASDLGLARPDAVAYDQLPDLGLLDRMLSSFTTATTVLRPGVILRLSVAGRPQHLGIAGNYFNGGISIIHAYMVTGSVVEHRLDDKWQKRIVRMHSMKGVD